MMLRRSTCADTRPQAITIATSGRPRQYSDTPPQSAKRTNTHRSHQVITTNFMDIHHRLSEGLRELSTI